MGGCWEIQPCHREHRICNRQLAMPLTGLAPTGFCSDKSHSGSEKAWHPGSSTQPNASSQIPAALVKSTSVHKFTAMRGLLESEPKRGLRSDTARTLPPATAYCLRNSCTDQAQDPTEQEDKVFWTKAPSLPLTLMYFPSLSDEQKHPRQATLHKWVCPQEK